MPLPKTPAPLWMGAALALCGCTGAPQPPQAIDRGPTVSEVDGPEARTGRGAGWVTVTVQSGAVRAELDRMHEVDQLVAAAQAALRSRGFVLDAAAGRLEEPLTVQGVMGGTPPSRRAEVAMLIGPTRLRIDVTVKPNGNDAESRAILKRMLELLGYGR